MEKDDELIPQMHSLWSFWGIHSLKGEWYTNVHCVIIISLNTWNKFVMVRWAKQQEKDNEIRSQVHSICDYFEAYI